MRLVHLLALTSSRAFCGNSASKWVTTQVRVSGPGLPLKDTRVGSEDRHVESAPSQVKSEKVALRRLHSAALCWCSP